MQKKNESLSHKPPLPSIFSYITSLSPHHNVGVPLIPKSLFRAYTSPLSSLSRSSTLISGRSSSSLGMITCIIYTMEVLKSLWSSNPRHRALIDVRDISSRVVQSVYDSYLLSRIHDWRARISEGNTSTVDAEG
jgi:hypothetical protein